MAELTYRQAVRRALTQELLNDDSVYFIGEDVGAAGGSFKASKGVIEDVGAHRVLDTPISEEAIIGAAMGAAMTGVRPIAEIMFSDFLATCWDIVAVQIPKLRYMTDGQVELPLVIRTANGGGLGFGAQHSQAVENWAMSIPGLKVVAPSTPYDVVALFAAAVRDPDPVIFFEQKSLYPTKGEVPDGEIVGELGVAKVVREGQDVTLVALAAMVPLALEAARELEKQGVSAEVIDVRSLVPLDVATIAASVSKTGRFVSVEENPRLCGWGAELASIVSEECFWHLEAPIRRVTAAHIPIPTAEVLEDAVLPSVADVVEACLEDGVT